MIAPDPRATRSPDGSAGLKQLESEQIDAGVRLDASIIAGFPIAHGFPVNGRMATYRYISGAATVGRSTLGGDALRAMKITSSGPIPAVPEITARFEKLWHETSGGSERLDPALELRLIAVHGARAVVERDKAGATHVGWRAGDSDVHKCAHHLCTGADDISIAGWTIDGGRLVFQARTFDVTRLLSWDISDDDVKILYETSGVLGSDESGKHGACQLVPGEAICILASAAAPPRLVAIGTESKTSRVLLDPNPAFRAERLGVERTLTLTDRYGNSTLARMLLPPHFTPGKRLPLVLTNYNCDGFLLGGSGQDVPEHVLAGLGFAAVCVDLGFDVVHRVPEFEVTQDSVSLMGRDFFEDVVKQLDHEGIVDPKRVSLNGFSGGSTAVALTISQTDVFTAAAVTTNGSLDPIVCYVTSPRDVCATLSRKDGLPLPYDGPSGVLRNSPALHVEKIRTPLLMQLAEVEYVAMLQLFSAMPRALIAEAVDLIVYIERGGPAGRRISEVYAPKLEANGALEPAARGPAAHRSQPGAET